MLTDLQLVTLIGTMPLWTSALHQFAGKPKLCAATITSADRADNSQKRLTVVRTV